LGLVIVSLLAKFNESRKKKDAKPNDTCPDSYFDFDEPVGQVQPEPVSSPVPVPSPESVYELSEEETIAYKEPQVPVKEPIDKKKLIVYSEIMKPKYLE